ncbi:MAG: hypothetical protein IPP71_22215 [Bacteroidetes bacterium]|nr:hypothetical protein [Bacteroidota bacterium]
MTTARVSGQPPISVARSGLSATTVGTKAFFAGGVGSGFNPSSVVDIYDNISTDINEMNKNEVIIVFPNPATNHLTIALGSNNKVEVAIADITRKNNLQNCSN